LKISSNSRKNPTQGHALISIHNQLGPSASQANAIILQSTGQA